MEKEKVKEMMRQARIRRKAREFTATIPTGMAMRLPDELLDSLSDKDVKDLFWQLEELGLQRQPGKPSFWERKY